jgi:hypothetical protein
LNVPINVFYNLYKGDKIMNKIMQAFSKMLSEVIEEEQDPVSNCCTAPFTHPGWPDSDFCSKCHEHAGIDEDG